LLPGGARPWPLLVAGLIVSFVYFLNISQVDNHTTAILKKAQQKVFVQGCFFAVVLARIFCFKIYQVWFVHAIYAEIKSVQLLV